MNHPNGCKICGGFGIASTDRRIESVVKQCYVSLIQAFFLDGHAKTQGKKTQGFTKTQGKFPPKTQGIGGFPPYFQQNSRYRRFLRLPERVGEQK